MVRKTSGEEEEILNRIREFRRDFRRKRKQELFDERTRRHNEGKVFFRGYWVPRDRLSTVLRRLRRRGWVVFIEIHLLFLSLILAFLIIWFIFKRFLLP